MSFHVMRFEDKELSEREDKIYGKAKELVQLPRSVC